MPSKQEKAVYEIRFEFVKAYDRGLYTMKELCERYNVSRECGYKWLRRYREGGLEALMDRSRRPLSSPGTSDDAVVKAILELRDKHKRWGARKLKVYLERYQPDVAWPSKSTIHVILKRNGRIEERRRRRRHAHPGRPVVAYDRPNRVWTADYKGQFRLGNGRYCYPLTVFDGHSRYLLECRALESTDYESARRVFRGVFREYGLPEYILTDNGTPFASTGLCGLSRLNVWWIKLGVIPKRIQPSHPEQNGRHERMHRTLKAEATRPPAETHLEQQCLFDEFRWVFNEERPHEALDQTPPAMTYERSRRRYPGKLSKMAYPPHAEVRLVSTNGGIRWKCDYLFVSQALAKEYIALEEVEDGIWSIYFGPVEIGRLNERNQTIT